MRRHIVFLLRSMALAAFVVAPADAQDCRLDKQNCGPGMGYTITVLSDNLGPRVTPEVGYTWPLSKKSAVRAGVFTDLDRLGVSYGPALHYRRLFSPPRAAEIVVGTQIESQENRRTRMLFTMLQYNAVPELGLAVRAERAWFTCPTCSPRTDDRIWAGLAFAGEPAFKVTAWGVGGFLLFLIVAIILLPDT